MYPSFLVDKIAMAGSYFLCVVYLSVLCPGDLKLSKCGWSLTPFPPPSAVFNVCDLAEGRSAFCMQEMVELPQGCQ